MEPDSFYTITPDPGLRFGDIIRGYPSVFATIDIGSTPYLQKGVSVVVDHEAYGVVLNPCCSIRDEKLFVAMLSPIDKNFLKIPKFQENPLLMNGPMHGKDAMAPERWSRMSPEDKASKETEGLTWVQVSEFVFAPHDLLPEYDIDIDGQKMKYGYYKIDFRECSLIKSKKIIKPETPVENISKILQLTVECRDMLREKLIAYYHRSAD